MRGISLLANIGLDIHTLAALQGSMGLEYTYIMLRGQGARRGNVGWLRAGRAEAVSHALALAREGCCNPRSHMTEWKRLMHLCDVQSNTGNISKRTSVYVTTLHTTQINGYAGLSYL